MTREGPELSGRAAALRDAFDRSFAVERVSALDELEDLLGIRIGGDGYVVRVREVAGLFVDRKILPLPSPVPELLGLSGLRGLVLPVYSLAGLLGYTAKVGAPRWLIVVGSDQQIGLAFEQFDGYLRVPRSAIGASAEKLARSHRLETAHAKGEERAIVSIPSIMKVIAEKVGVERTKKEP